MTTDPTLTYRAVQTLRPELPNLLENDWPTIAHQLATLDAQWDIAAGDTERMLLAARYRTLFWSYDVVRRRLYELEGSAPLAYWLLSGAADMAAAVRAESSAKALRQAGDFYADNQRLIIESGPGRPAYSIKLSNLEFYFWELSAAAGDALSAVDTLTDPVARPFAQAGAILSLIGRLSRTIVRPIAVDDTSVFLGLVEAAGEARQAHLAQITSATNAQRVLVYLSLLSEEQVKRSLAVLNGLRSIAPVAGATDVWRVVEEHGRV